ncbi:hypothetical protein [Gordonia terrae]
MTESRTSMADGRDERLERELALYLRHRGADSITAVQVADNLADHIRSVIDEHPETFPPGAATFPPA